jgi:HEAT repeat protein
MRPAQSALTDPLHHADSHIRSQAALTLGKLGNPENVLVLVNALQNETDLFVREDITWALVKLGAAAVLPLIALLQSENPQARHDAAHALGKVGDSRAVPALVVVLHDADSTVGFKAMFALGQIGAAQAIPALLSFLADERPEIRELLTQVLEQFGGTAVPLLSQALAHPRWQVREHAAEILGLIGTRDAVPVLVAALHDEAWQVRYAAVFALHTIGGATAKTALKTMPPDSSPEVARLVAEVLRRNI